MAEIPAEAVEAAARDFRDILGYAPSNAYTYAAIAVAAALPHLRAQFEADHTPTQWAYDQACKALEKHRARADAAEARLTEARAKVLAEVDGALRGLTPEYDALGLRLVVPIDDVLDEVRDVLGAEREGGNCDG